jgi:hypothetical protein
MRFLISAGLSLVISIVVANASGIGLVGGSGAHRMAATSEASADPVPASSTQPPAPPAKITVLTPELKAKILEAMRLNRRAFQESAILARYGDKRLQADHPAFVSCDLPRTPTGEPASQYPASTARTTPRAYSEAAIVECVGTKGGLEGKRAKPLTQHYYCSLPGLSPDIRACFTFQLRLPRVAPKRDITDDHGYLPDGTRLQLVKGWDFLGPDPNNLPDAGEAFKYCATDGRPHSIKSKKGKHNVSTIHPTPTRPTCWIAETQLDLFQGLMGGLIDVPLKDQVALLNEYYECDKIKGKVSAKRFKALCQIDVSQFQ